MEILDPKEASFVVGLLDFTLEGEEEGHKTMLNTASFTHERRTGSFPAIVEEELEWLSNKDAFPAVETCFGILSDNPQLISNHHSPVSVLENATSNSDSNNSNGSTVASCFDCLKVPTNFPVRARSNRRRRKRRADFGDSFLNKKELSFLLPPVVPMRMSCGGGGASLGRRCLHCQVDKTPQWRAGPLGPKTLCNACGVRYKSGRLVPEYRPANSPTFSSALHSNSHRKVVEMRKKKEIANGGG